MIRHTYRHEGSFGFEAGGSITNLEVVYHTSPQEYSKDKKVIWLCHALTASSDPEGEWWPALVGPGKTIDTNKYFVICANVLGSACGSSGPASLNPATGKPYYFDFPKVTVHDTVVAFDLLREHLGIEKIDLIVSTSMGGFMTFDWLAWKPELFDKVFFIATGAREDRKSRYERVYNDVSGSIVNRTPVNTLLTMRSRPAASTIFMISVITAISPRWSLYSSRRYSQ